MPCYYTIYKNNSNKIKFNIYIHLNECLNSLFIYKANYNITSINRQNLNHQKSDVHIYAVYTSDEESKCYTHTRTHTQNHPRASVH